MVSVTRKGRRKTDKTFNNQMYNTKMRNALTACDTAYLRLDYVCS